MGHGPWRRPAEQSAASRGTAPASRCQVSSLRHAVRSEFIKTFSEIVLKPSLTFINFRVFLLFRSKPSQFRIVFPRQTVDMQQVRFSSSQLTCLDFQQKLQEAHFVQDKQCFGGRSNFS